MPVHQQLLLSARSSPFWLFYGGLIAALLLLAAISKGLAFLSGTFDPLENANLLIVVMCWEVVLSIWLLAGFKAAACRSALMVTFLLFAGYASARAADGEASCHCFGNIGLSPWACDVV